MRALNVPYAGILWVALLMLAVRPFSVGASEIGAREFNQMTRLAPPLERKAELLSRRFEILLARHQLTLEAAEARCRGGEWGACGLLEWQEFLHEIESLSEEDKIYQVHRYVNRFRYVTDARNWRRPDYWAVPEQFFEKGGDCEDYVIAKYLSLRALGIGDERLKVIVVYDGKRREDHAILAVAAAGDLLILDNYRRRVMRWSQMSDRYRPSYSLNQNTVSIHGDGS